MKGCLKLEDVERATNTNSPTFPSAIRRVASAASAVSSGNEVIDEINGWVVSGL